MHSNESVISAESGLVSSRVSLTSWRGASLALVGHPSSDGVTIKIPYGVDVLLHQPASHPIFTIGLVNELWPYYQKDVNQMTLNHTTR